LFRPVNISKFDYSNNIPTLTFVSGIGIYTRHEKLIEIFARIVQRIPTVQLLLVGPDSDGLSKVLETIHRLGLTDKVTITGLLPHDELPKYLGRADVYISARPETFGVNIIEAMACGLPIVSFKQSALPELVRNEVDGHLVETDEEFIERVLLLLQDRRLAHTMGKNGRQRVLEMFTWKRVIDRVVEGYALALENFERRRRKSTST
jgi:glycosyltransferase involved in cell wall biosynthesis